MSTHAHMKTHSMYAQGLVVPTGRSLDNMSSMENGSCCVQDFGNGLAHFQVVSYPLAGQARLSIS